MTKPPIFHGLNPDQALEAQVDGSFVKIGGEDYYKISHFDKMRPFFMSIVSSGDLWMFVSSKGGLTAGRKNPQFALFPYYTDDKIHDSGELTGSKSIFFIHKEGRKYLWEPFSVRGEGIYKVQRNIYKHTYGNKLIFEEINESLQVSFRYAWESSEKFGWVRRAVLKNLSQEEQKIELLDGMQNLLPYGVNLDMQTELSTLVDAYKKNELDAGSGMGIYSLSSILVDKPEPSESLKATSVWSMGLTDSQHLLSSVQLDDFRKGRTLREEKDVRAERGAYFLHSQLDLKGGEAKEWYMVAELNQSHADLTTLIGRLKKEDSLLTELKQDIANGTEKLALIVANADAFQQTADQLSMTRHFSNVLFNVMRGGIFDQGYQISRSDVGEFIQKWNQKVYDRSKALLDTLDEKTSIGQLKQLAEESGDPQFIRMANEYLPLTFSRRHGDPSRPWNFFSIETQDEHGSPILNFQGNWRDIFQNWEALCVSYPEYTESIIYKFLNASTADGYNPYRITRDGIDWEVIDPHDPWSFIGYWGDHQIIYLLKLMELSKKHHPDVLENSLQKEIFVYANVPYKIKAFEQLLADPRDTIIFDEALHSKIDELQKEIGADGKLILGANAEPFCVNLAEKLLLTALTKLSNFVPEGGIWMNTQRPEWNDANNALVGYGISMVTLCYLRRYLKFLKDLFQNDRSENIELTGELTSLFQSIHEVFQHHHQALEGPINPKERMDILKGLGLAGERYRQQVYEGGFSASKGELSKKELQEFFDLSLEFLDHSIRANKREDHLYHSYNLLEADGDELEIRYLYEMLEGQVAVLSTGLLSVDESLELLTALKKSKLYREDQYSYLLYPDRQLPRFRQKNRIPKAELNKLEILTSWIEKGDTRILEQDEEGISHFSGNFRNAVDLKEALDQLKSEQEISAKEEEVILDIFELVFDHKSFTGRSGTFYGYEGLGSIYWHMVSKLVLAVNEIFFRFPKEEMSSAQFGQLVEFYYEIRAGLGLNKNPELYGSFPTDPYSHTPGNAGAQQPGMTGQVKEDILSRMGELGMIVENGQIHFNPIFLRKAEFQTESSTFNFYSEKGEIQKLDLPPNSLAFTYCQTPIIYKVSEQKEIRVHKKGGQTEKIEGLSLGEKISESLFKRDGSIHYLEVSLEALL
ncbi:MAG: hypothetical protein R8P61_00035 [Bacteroidia bacterium]|nr:hypothetical protein [Bacteroidia bacterium]